MSSHEVSANGLELRPCHNCRRKILTPIIDNATGDRICHNCAGPHVNPDIIRFAKKIQRLFEEGRDLEKAYPLAERILNISGHWEPFQ